MSADDLAGRSVLIVDDAPENLRLLSKVLKRAGLVPRPVTSGRLALEAAQIDPPDLVLLDVRMPDTSGFDVCRQFKRDQRLRNIPVLFISGLGHADDRIEAFSAGGVDFIPKPIDEREVLARVRTHLELRRLHEALESQNLTLTIEQRRIAARHAALSRAARDALIMLDGSGRIAHWNEAAEGMFGWTMIEALGRDFYQLVGLDSLYRDHFQLRLAQDEVDAAAKTFELDIRTKAGDLLPIEVSLASTDLEGSVCTVGIFRDISSRRRTEERLRREIEERRRMELELRHAQKLEAVGQLASGIAHEINTPVQFVGDSLQFLKDAFDQLVALLDGYRNTVSECSEQRTVPDPSALRALEEGADLEYLLSNIPLSLERCLDGVARVASIVRSMKEFAHADQREQRPADLNRAIANTLVIAKNEYKYVADIETDFADLPDVTCHVSDLNQVFLNLIVNAAHAIADVVRDGGARGRIAIRTRREGESVRIQVGDTGTGIPESVQPRVFEPFFTTKPVGKGTGQGLAIAHSIIVNKHGGSIAFETEIGKGTTFTILLPIVGRTTDSSIGPTSPNWTS